MDLSNIPGIIINNNSNPLLEKKPVKPVLETPKAGKYFKIKNNKASLNDYNFKVKRNIEIEKSIKKTRLEAKQLEIELKLNKEQIKEEIKQKRIKKKESKKDSEGRQGGLQIIKNSKKLRKWNKKARNQWIKMPKELFEDYLKKNYS